MLRLIQTYKRQQNKKVFKNVVEVHYSMQYLVQIVGAAIFMIESTPGNVIISTFSRIGFALFLFWYTLYFYCVYGDFVFEQSFLRTYYNTQLKYYGDIVEKIVATMYILFAMWKIPFDLSSRSADFQMIVDIDKAMEDLGERMDIYKHSFLVISLLISQITITGTRILVVSLPFRYLNNSMPLQKLFHMIFFDGVIFIMTAHYCFYLFLIRTRYQKLNKILHDIKSKSCHEFFMFRVRKEGITDTAVRLQDTYVSEKIKKCGRIYDMLFKATEIVNNKFYYSLWITLGVCLSLIVLYLYYFMEATAAGLFHDTEKYIDFLCYVFWQFGFSFTVIFLHIYFSDNTVKEAKITSYTAHAIINSDLDASIKTEAFHLSVQILHQTPVFSGCGLHRLNYELLLEGMRSVVTFLVIMLQFVAENRSN